MSENTNPTATESGNPTPQEAGRTFTQDDVNRIVQERLAKEKTKSAADLAQREQDIIKREQEIQRVEQMKQLKERLFWFVVPDEAFEILDTSNPDEIDKMVKLIEKIAPKKSTGMSFSGMQPPSLGSSNPIRDAMGLNKKE